MGTTYDINKDLVKRFEHALSADELDEKEKLIHNFLSRFQDHYYMLLCHDRRDYTIFHTNTITNSIWKDLYECLHNRGNIMSIDETEDKGAIEIWLLIEDEAYCYYFFPYESAVVEY